MAVLGSLHIYHAHCIIDCCTQHIPCFMFYWEKHASVVSFYLQTAESTVSPISISTIFLHDKQENITCLFRDEKPLDQFLIFTFSSPFSISS